MSISSPQLVDPSIFCQKLTLFKAYPVGKSGGVVPLFLGVNSSRLKLKEYLLQLYPRPAITRPHRSGKPMPEPEKENHSVTLCRMDYRPLMLIFSERYSGNRTTLPQILAVICQPRRRFRRSRQARYDLRHPE